MEATPRPIEPAVGPGAERPEAQPAGAEPPRRKLGERRRNYPSFTCVRDGEHPGFKVEREVDCQPGQGRKRMVIRVTEGELPEEVSQFLADEGFQTADGKVWTVPDGVENRWLADRVMSDIREWMGQSRLFMG